MQTEIDRHTILLREVEFSEPFLLVDPSRQLARKIKSVMQSVAQALKHFIQDFSVKLTFAESRQQSMLH